MTQQPRVSGSLAQAKNRNMVVNAFTDNVWQLIVWFRFRRSAAEARASLSVCWFSGLIM
jgi:hypothetical protein